MNIPRAITRLLWLGVLVMLGSLALADGTYEFVDATYVRTETDANQVLNVRVRRTGGTASEDITIRGNGATAGTDPDDDFFGNSGATDSTVTITGNNGIFNVPFTINGNNLTENDVTVTFTFFAPGFSDGGTVAGLGTSVLTIQDDDVASYSFSSPTYSISENDATGTLTFTITRTGALGAEQVNYQIGAAGDSAIGGGVDYIGGGAGLFTMGATQTSRDVDITIVDDFALEPDEEITLSFTSFGVRGVTGATPTATVTILNDDQSIGFSDTNYGVVEGDTGSTTNVVTLERAGDLSVTQIVEVSVIGGSATAGTDFAAGPYTTAFGPGQATRSINVGILGENLVEGDEDIQLQITEVETGGVVTNDYIDLSANTATLVIEDDDAATYRFGSATYSTPEGAAATTTDVTITVERTGGTGDENVTVQVTGASATPGSDYVNPGGGVVVLNFVGADTEQTFDITVNGDDVLEGDETINVAIVGTSSTGAIGLPSTATLTILNDEREYRFANTAFSINEGDIDNFNNTVTVERVGDVSVAEDVTINDLVTGSATAGVASPDDYTAGPWTAAFAAGATTATVPIAIIGDRLSEPDQTIALEIGATSGTGIIGTPDQTVLNIVNDDVATYEFTAATFAVLEGDVNATTNVVQLTRTGAIDDAETVQVSITGGSADNPADYTTGTPIDVIFAAGDVTLPVPIDIVGDTTFEPNETINLAITNATPDGQIGAQNTTTLTITNDDDVSVYQFTQATYEVLEDDVTNTTNIVQLERTGATNIAEDVNVVLTNGTGVVGSDVTAGPITVNFGIGDVVADVPIAILGDEGFEADETINVAIASTSGSGQAGPQDTAELTLTNDDQQYTFSSATYSVAEGAGPVTTVTVEREGPPINETVTITATGGTATAGAGNDYDGTLEAVFTATGSDSVAIDLVILEDAVAEGDETIELEIDAAFETGTPDSAIVTITDNDSDYEFTAATYSQPEGNTTGNATVVLLERTGGVNTAATVEVTVANSATAPSATAGDDFTAGIVNVNFTAGEATATVPVEILGDTTIEPDENIDLTITTVPAGSTIGAQNTARLTLLNDDGVATFSFTAATYSITETNTNDVATSLVTLTRSDPAPAADVTVNYVAPTMPPSLSTSTAVEGDDFFVQDALVPNPVTCTAVGATANRVFPCTVRFAAGAATAVLPITIVGDTTAEVSERIVLTFNNGDIAPVAPSVVSPGVATTPNTTTLTIADNDSPAGADLEVLNGISPTSPLIFNGTNTTINFPVTSLGVPVTREFTLRNAGDSNLSVFSINLPAGFSLVGGFPNVLAGNSSETITIRYDAATTGISGGDVEIASSDFLDSPYVFPIRGSLETSEIDVTFNGQSLVDGNATVDFGSTVIGTPVTATLTISNPSGVVLLLSNLVLPDGYTIVGDFPDSVPANSSADVIIQLDAVTAGTFTGTVSFDSNDEDESTFSLTATGTVTEQPEPEVRVSGPLGDIESGGSYDFGVSALGESPTATFTVTNGGTEDLTLDRASLTSSLAGTAFSVSSNFAETTLAPSASTTFEIGLDASSAGNFTTTLSFTNNDSDENPFGIALSGEVSAPEIEVRQDARVLQDGSSVPIDFGATTLNAPVTVTFTVNNLGSVPLSLGGLDVPVGFALEGDFPTSIDGSGSATFSLVLEATSLGSFDGQVSFENGDADESPFTFRVQGVVDAADITVLDGLLTVPNGSTVDFGSTTEDNAVNKIFTIRNDGGATLQVDNLSTLPAGFALLSPEPFTFELAPNQQATFTVALTGETVGDFSGALQFISNDTTASPFSVTLEGRVTAEPAPEISVSSESSAVASGSAFTFEDLPVGEDATETFTIRNTGTAPLSLGSVTVSGDSFALAGDIGITSLEAGASTTFDIRFEADEEGEALGSVSIDNGDENENPYIFDLDAAAFVPSPEVAVRGSDNSAITDGSSLDLGTVVTGADASVTFTVTNEGEATLTLGDLAISGDGFAISNGLGSTTLEPDASTTFAVRFTAGEDEGEASGEVTFTNNDSDENPYNITLSADVEVPQPEIAVVRGGALIADDGTFDFGDVAVGQARNIDFTVQNSGTATLNLEPLEITGEGFALESPFANTTLEPEASTTFTLRFNSADLTPGEYSGSISFANNDGDENPYNFALTANVFVPVPEIAVTDPNGQALEDGSSVILSGVGVGTPSVVAVFTVRNEGDANLTLNAASLASSLAGTPFSVRNSFGQSSLAPEEDTQFTLGVDTSSAGTFSANVAFNNNDRDENPFNISLSITISAGPEVDVRDGNISIPDGGVTAVNIGETTVGTPITRTLSVLNAGGATLTLNAGSFQIDNSAFTLVGTPPASLAPGQSGSLVIQLNADVAGSPVAQVSFTSNDSDESPYTFTVRGTVTTSGNGSNGEQVVIRAGNNPPPTTITANPGDSNVAVLQALLSLEGDIAARMTRFDVRVFELLNGNRTQITGIGDFTGLAAAKLYQDSNNNGQVDVSDALLATTTTFDANGNLVFDLGNPLPLSNTSVTNVIVAYDFLADFSTNRLPVVALASLLPLLLLALKRLRRVSLLMFLVIFMAACGSDNGNGGNEPPPVGAQYQAFLVDAEAESNGQALDVTFATGDIPGSIVSLQD